MALHTNRYSVPVDWIGRRVEVRETKDKIEIQLDARRLVTHRRIAEAEHQRVMLAEHRPPRGQGIARPDPHPEEKAILAAAPELADYVAGLKQRSRKVRHACPAATAAPGARVSTGTAAGSGAGGRPLWSLRSGPAGTHDPAPRGARILSARRREPRTMTEELEQLLKNLKLRRILEIYDEQLRAAEKDDVSYSEFVTRLVRAQWHARQEGALEWRIRRANLPERWSLETFPFARQPGVNRKQIRGFAELEFIAKAENIVLVGQTGVGKTGLACGLLLKALENGYRCQFIRAQDLFDEMYASLADRSTRQLLKRLARLDVLLIDEFGYLNLKPEQSQHLLQADGRALPPAFHHHHHESWSMTSGRTFWATGPWWKRC